MTQIREALDKYLDDRQRARREFWAMVAAITVVVVGCVVTLGRLQP